MHITPYQIVSPLIAIIAIVYAWGLYNRKKKTLWEAVLWTIFWGLVAFIALFPSSLSYLVLATGIKNQESALLVTAIAILFFMMFYVVVRLEDIAYQQTRIIRAQALRDSNLPERKEEYQPKA